MQISTTLQVCVCAPPDRLQHVDERPQGDPEETLQVLRPRPPPLRRVQPSQGVRVNMYQF